MAKRVNFLLLRDVVTALTVARRSWVEAVLGLEAAEFPAGHIKVWNGHSFHRGGASSFLLCCAAGTDVWGFPGGQRRPIGPCLCAALRCAERPRSTLSRFLDTLLVYAGEPKA